MGHDASHGEPEDPAAATCTAVPQPPTQIGCQDQQRGHDGQQVTDRFDEQRCRRDQVESHPQQEHRPAPVQTTKCGRQSHGGGHGQGPAERQGQQVRPLVDEGRGACVLQGVQLRGRAAHDGQDVGEVEGPPHGQDAQRGYHQVGLQYRHGHDEGTAGGPQAGFGQAPSDRRQAPPSTGHVGGSENGEEEHGVETDTCRQAETDPGDDRGKPGPAGYGIQDGRQGCRRQQAEQTVDGVVVGLLHRGWGHGQQQHREGGGGRGEDLPGDAPRGRKAGNRQSC